MSEQSHVLSYAFKLPLRSEPPAFDELIVVFHDWIRTKALADDVLIDVADYAHVQEGPGVLLVCHEGHYVLDRSRGSVGLAYHRRRGVPAAIAGETAAVALRRLIRAARLLEQDERLRGKLAFDTTSLEIRALDRLRAPNDAEGWTAIEVPIREAIASVWREPPLELVREDGDPRRPLSARARLSARTLSDLAV